MKVVKGFGVCVCVCVRCRMCVYVCVCVDYSCEIAYRGVDSLRSAATTVSGVFVDGDGEGVVCVCVCVCVWRLLV